ncbi:hypothetical protein HWV62_45226 [Athelia sp. TMB]|nr:hypothetical protein HWV62_45226 [Athelia sp. TMB]
MTLSTNDDIFNVQEKTTEYNDTPELGQNPKSLSSTSDDTSDEVDTSDEADTSDEPPDNSDGPEPEPEPEASTESIIRSPEKSENESTAIDADVLIAGFHIPLNTRDESRKAVMSVGATQVLKLRHQAQLAYDEFKSQLARARTSQLQYEAKKDDFYVASGALRFYARTLEESVLTKPDAPDEAEVPVLEKNCWGKRQMYRSNIPRLIRNLPEKDRRAVWREGVDQGTMFCYQIKALSRPLDQADFLASPPMAGTSHDGMAARVMPISF